MAPKPHTAPQKVVKATLASRIPEPTPAEPAYPHKVWYICLVGGGAVLLLAALVSVYHRTMPGWEQQLFRDVNGVSAPKWLANQIAKPLSDAVWALVGLSFVALAVPRFRWRAWQYVAALGSSFVAQYLLEHIIDRPRPALLMHDVVLRAQQGGPGFPSGHVTALTALVLTMWFFVSWPWRALLAALLVAEMWARIFLGVHAPLDVVGGLAMGMLTVGVLHLLPVKLRRFFKLA
ncbi:MAG TPA: phosphatase PAP2 family protein [Candidatus Saccharimonadales bacterium]|nr:phosphatase PAP2 family protein [Candidatus Saccharimonadales bacterium]